LVPCKWNVTAGPCQLLSAVGCKFFLNETKLSGGETERYFLTDRIAQNRQEQNKWTLSRYDFQMILMN
jgi:hypothetical protein